MTQQSFADLGVSAPIIAALERRGITTPFPIQTLVMGDALAGRDVLARSRTGSGKTLAFGIPIAQRHQPAARKPVALVLVPTRELAAQVVEEIDEISRATGLRVAAAYGGVSIREQGRAVSKADVLVATPGRLEDLATRRLVDLSGVKVLILDEADRMLDMGFQPQVDKLVRRVPKDRQTMFFSATLDGAVGHLARAYTREPVRHEVEAKIQTVDEAGHRFVPVEMADKVETLIGLLRAEPGLALVFVRTKRGADRLVTKLRARGVDAVGMHGDLSQQQRERALARFEAGKVSTLVATDVAARGLDVENIAHVINYDPPNEDKDYVHRVGRTARAGKTGLGVTLVTPDQRSDVSRMAARLKLHEEFEAEGMTVAPPRVMFTSKGRKAGMRRPGMRPRRRF
jgi:superfamily II DNA/RNA helicase